MKFPLLFGSYRRDRNGIRLVRYIRPLLEDRGHEVPLVDARETDLPMLDRMYKEYGKGEAPEAMDRLAAMFREADGFLIVAGEYNHSIQPGLKNLMDHFLEEYFFRPSAIACYSAGGIGGMRVAMHLRAVLGELGMPSIPSIMSVAGIEKSLSESGEDLTGGMGNMAARFLSEFEWYARALKAEREKGLPY